MNHSTHPPSPHFEILIGNAELEFRRISIPDPIVTGRQILEAAGARPVDEHLAIALLPDGALETLRQEELFDLRAKGAEKVLVFRTDRSFRFKIDDRESEWVPT